jgi:hypothetical protein
MEPEIMNDTKPNPILLPHERWRRADKTIRYLIACAESGDLQTTERILFGRNPARVPDIPDAVGSRVRDELAAAQADLIALASTDPVSAARRVRRLQADMRRIWWPPIVARLHPVRPRLPRCYEDDE